MAELLIRAKGHWKDEWKPSKVNSLTPPEKRSYDARTQLGDIVVVKPNGWKWGKAECLPEYVLVKIPDMTVEEAKQYEDSIYETYLDENNEEQTRIVRHRKWFVKPTWMDTIISQGGEWTIDKATVINYIEGKIL